MPTLTAEEWTDHYDDPAWVRAQRDALRELGFDVPTSLARLPDWLESHKGAVTKALKEGDD
jgi:hypothetical protein